ncbi:MAG: hypothetical protein CM1200mP2_30650 [Planctomycetaceae bacterium]|nr:MAG: hypothetical protein CM1200mP2_30650 [Planctomycetaceae bacterium]
MQPTTNTKQPDRPAQEPDSLPEQAESARILRRLADRVGPKNYENWFLGRCTVTIEGDEVRFGVGSPFVVSWMQRQFREAMQGTATDVLGPSARVRLDVDPNVMPEVVGDGGSTANKRTSAVGGGTGSENATPGGDRDSGAGGRRSGTRRRFADLGDFVVGDSNRLAWTAASRICDAPADGLSPLYLFGHVGVGKTHLLEGISRRIRRLYPSLRVTYLTAEMFTNYFTAALRERSTPGFRQRFRSIDVLLVDDVDFLDAKKGVQEEFLHTLKQLEANGSHVVLAANQHPRLLAKFSEELSSRLMAGLVCRIEPPELGTRQEIVGRLAKRMAVTFTPEALAVVARRFTHSVRELKGGLYCLQNWSIASGRQRISARVSRRVLAELERDCIRKFSRWEMSSGRSVPCSGCGRRVEVVSPDTELGAATDAGDVPGPQAHPGRLQRNRRVLRGPEPQHGDVGGGQGPGLVVDRHAGDGQLAVFVGPGGRRFGRATVARRLIGVWPVRFPPFDRHAPTGSRACSGGTTRSLYGLFSSCFSKIESGSFGLDSTVGVVIEPAGTAGAGASSAGGGVVGCAEGVWVAGEAF